MSNELPKQLSIAILGVSGRMGRALLSAIDETPGAVLSGASASANSRWLGKDAAAPSGGAARNLLISADAAGAVRGANVVIDFTLPEATVANAQACAAAGCPLIIGTTGHDEAAQREIERAAQRIAIVLAPNMSLGVN